MTAGLTTKTIMEDRNCTFCAFQKGVKPPSKFPTPHEVRKTINSEFTICRVCDQQEYNGPRGHEITQHGRKAV